MSSELAVVEEHETGITLFGTNDPVAVIESARRVAEPLAQLIRDRHLATNISGREHVRVEGWTLLGSMLGVFPVTEWTRPLTDADGKALGWEARVTVQRADGAVIGAAEAECLRAEANWKGRDDYALRSMAQTRAASKALRMPLGFVMQLAGFDPTPAEEIPAQGFSKATPAGADTVGSCPSCDSPVYDNRDQHNEDSKKPAFRCSNRSCQGGGPKKDGGNWPWASWDEKFFSSDVQDAEGGDIVDRMNRKVTAHILSSGETDEVAAMDRAEAAVYETANDLGLPWPSQALEKDDLNAILEAAKERA